MIGFSLNDLFGASGEPHDEPDCVTILDNEGNVLSYGDNPDKPISYRFISDAEAKAKAAKRKAAKADPSERRD